MSDEQKRAAVLEWLDAKLDDLYTDCERAAGYTLRGERIKNQIDTLEYYRDELTQDFIPASAKQEKRIRERWHVWQQKVGAL